MPNRNSSRLNSVWVVPAEISEIAVTTLPTKGKYFFIGVYSPKGVSRILSYRSMTSPDGPMKYDEL